MAQSKYYTKNENGIEEYVFSNEMYDLTMSSNGEVSFDVKQKRRNVEKSYGAIINQIYSALHY